MKKILVVDDSSTMRESIRIILTTGGYKVETAVDGQDGLDKFLNDKEFSLILSDINMPNMNGLDFLKNLRKVSKEIPVIILTTETDKEKIEEAKSYKASAWIVKPFQPNDLKEVVAKILEG